MKKRVLSLLLSLTLALSLLPAAAWAASPNSVTAYVTISVAGQIQSAKDNSMLMVRAPVTVTDLNANGTIDIDDALRAAHAKYADNAHGYTSADGQYGLGITMLWGDTSGAFGYYVDNASASGLTDSVSDGDSITAYIYRDTTTWSDQYTHFDKETAVAATNSNIGLTLTAVGWSGSAPLANAQLVTLDTATGNANSISGKTTDTNGQVTLSFATAGTYYVSATSSTTTIVPPVCVVTVKESLSDADYVAAAKAQLTWSAIKAANIAQNNVTANLTLPSTISVSGTNVAVSWSCSDTTGALMPYGSYGYAYVDRPKSTDVETTLTATLSSGGVTDTCAFDLTVKAEGVTTSQTVVAYGSLMAGIAGNYADTDAATSAITDSDIPWTMIDMVRYGGVPGEATRYTSLQASNSGLAKYILAEAARGHSVSAPSATDADIWSAPSILLARYAAGAKAKEDNAALITIMTDYLTGNSLDVDTVAMALPALALYYSSDAAIKAAVDTAVTWLSTQQNTDGTFSSYGVPNAESTALAIVALSALGIDAHTDSRFIKNYNSAVEGLMTFALTNNSGFGHKGNVTYNAMATEQGFRALVAYANFKNGGKAYNIYTDATTAATSGTVPAPNISVISAPVIVPPTGSITVSFTLVGDTVHGNGPHTAYITWIPATTVTVKSRSTVGTVFTSILSKNGYAYVGAAQGYVSSITTPGGVTLSEKSNGKNSGWMYSVNGVDAAVGLNDYVLSNGDTIRWFYEDDYTTRNGMGGGSEKPGTSAQVKYADVSEAAWYKDAVSYVAEKGLIAGTGADTFSPSATLSRAMLVTALWNLAGKPAATACAGFVDVADDAYYEEAVNWAKSAGVAAGYGSAFGANDPITRQQLAAMLFGYAKRMGYDTAKAASLAAFTDVGSITDWAKAAAEWANAEGLMAGRTTSTLAPLGTATRAETAAVLMRFCINLVK
ncbi:MAG: S-layer homology domain-containing protein [Oscillospiraceae bacterium]|nr:S-layer homology domain-containing protein [Oscillospiraceae bacterium]